MKHIVKKLGPELMIYDSLQDEVHILNPSSGIIYGLYHKGKTVAEITAILQETFQFEENCDLAQDVGKCLEELESKGLLTKS